MRITMQYKMFLIKYAEIGTKGKNRYVFEEIMCKRMRARLKPLGKFEDTPGIRTYFRRGVLGLRLRGCHEGTHNDLRYRPVCARSRLWRS